MLQLSAMVIVQWLPYFIYTTILNTLHPYLKSTIILPIVVYEHDTSCDAKSYKDLAELVPCSFAKSAQIPPIIHDLSLNF